MNKKILKYVHYYIDYEINKLRRIDFMSLLKSLSTSSRSFYSLIMNFIIDLFSKDEYDIIIIVVDRFLKRVTFEIEKKVQTIKK